MNEPDWMTVLELARNNLRREDPVAGSVLAAAVEMVKSYAEQFFAAHHIPEANHLEVAGVLVVEAVGQFMDHVKKCGDGPCKGHPPRNEYEKLQDGRLVAIPLMKAGPPAHR